MSAAFDLAAAHCAHLSPVDQQSYLLGFNAGQAVRALEPGLSVDDDRESFFRSLIAQDDTAAAAGFLEGVAATRAVVPVPQPRRAHQKAVA